jgi:hypothetical protein
MRLQIQRTVSFLVVTAFIGLALLCFVFFTPVAFAAIRQLEEAPGQVVYQSRQTLKDQHNASWQAIAFKRIHSDGSTSFYLRLVSFPGAAEIAHSQPLTLTNSMGQILNAVDASSQIFTDASSPEPNVGQYDLQPILPQLRVELPWQLSVPTTHDETRILHVPPFLVQEWQTVAHSE